MKHIMISSSHDRMNVMNIKGEHQKLVARLKSEGVKVGRFDSTKYLGTGHVVYNVPVPKRRELAKAWAREHKDIREEELVGLVDALFKGASHEEKCMASLILDRYPEKLIVLDAHWLDAWMGELTGWGEVDSFCDEIDVWLRADVAKRASLLKKWNKDKQIEKRRASLVVLCSSVRNDNRQMFRDLSFAFIDNLKAEKHVMITKAISWLLRSLITYHKAGVARYLKENASSLPKIAVREVTRKLETGKK